MKTVREHKAKPEMKKYTQKHYKEIVYSHLHTQISSNMNKLKTKGMFHKGGSEKRDLSMSVSLHQSMTWCSGEVTTL